MRRKDKESNKKLFMSLFIVIVMVLSVVGYMFGRNGGDSTLEYNGYSITKKGDKWSAVINKKEAVFDYFPAEVENINISPVIIDRILNTLEVDTTYDINNSYAKSISYSEYGISDILDKHFNIYVRMGFTTDNDYKLPIITCNDSTAAVPVIYFKESNTTQIYLDNNCIIAEGKSDLDFIKIKDRLLYRVLGIIR